MTRKEEEALYDYMDDIYRKLEHLKGRMYNNDNVRADRNCPKIYQIQNLLMEVMDEYDNFDEES